jgi:hypothetical protein
MVVVPVPVSGKLTVVPLIVAGPAAGIVHAVVAAS